MPDLILSDVMMPRMNGEELCRAIRNEPGGLSRVPFVLLTARADVDHKLSGLEIGANDYLFKPFNPQELTLRINNLLLQRRQEKALFRSHRRIDEDLQIAREFHHSLLPKIELPEGLAAHAFYRPVDAVGGDIYEAFTDARGCTRLLLVDVTDHGVQAALRSMVVLSEYARIKTKAESPGKLIRELNERVIKQYDQRVSASLCCVELEPEVDGKVLVRFAQAGHAPIVHVAKSGQRHSPKAHGMILGIVSTARYDTGEMVLEQGDRLFMFTDGIEEQGNEKQTLFADAGLAQVLAATRQRQTVTEAVDWIIEEVDRFRGEAAQEDDFTLIGIELRGRS